MALFVFTAIVLSATYACIGLPILGASKSDILDLTAARASLRILRNDFDGVGAPRSLISSGESDDSLGENPSEEELDESSSENQTESSNFSAVTLTPRDSAFMESP